jgi:hypothetical protein
MRNIAERDLLLRERIELPEGTRLAMDEFRDGWNFSRSVNALHLEKRILRRGWSFLKIGDGSLRSGIGETSQEAIGSALKLVLHNISEQFNAVEVANIDLTHYPWFFLARINVYTYRIQKGAFLHLADSGESIPIAPERIRLSPPSAMSSPHLAAMPALKEMLVLSRRLGNRTL